MTLVEVLHKPFKQIFLHQYVEYDSPEALARTVALQSGATQSVSLSWADGLVFKIISPPFVISELLEKDFMEGKLHISVLYTQMPKFKPTINAAEEKIQVPVLDESNNKDALVIVDWLKNQRREKS